MYSPHIINSFKWQLISRLNLRTRALVSTVFDSHAVVSNPKACSNWPPPHDHGSPNTRTKCKRIMYQLGLLEQHRLAAARKFNMPEVNVGDLVQVKYELSRTQQTYAVFKGYCVQVRKRGLDSSFRIKNVLDGVGVEQQIPIYSPRLLNVKVLKSLTSRPDLESIERPITRDYRYKFHKNVRHRFAKANGLHKPGIRNFETRLANRIKRLKEAYYKQRLEAGLPPYVWAGAYNLRGESASAIRSRLVRAETSRRIQIYSMDEQAARAQKLHKRRQKYKWGNYKLPGTSFLDSLRVKHEPSGD